MKALRNNNLYLTARVILVPAERFSGLVRASLINGNAEMYAKVTALFQGSGFYLTQLDSDYEYTRSKRKTVNHH